MCVLLYKSRVKRFLFGIGFVRKVGYAMEVTCGKCAVHSCTAWRESLENMSILINGSITQVTDDWLRSLTYLSLASNLTLSETSWYLKAFREGRNCSKFAALWCFRPQLFVHFRGALRQVFGWTCRWRWRRSVQLCSWGLWQMMIMLAPRCWMGAPCESISELQKSSFWVAPVRERKRRIQEKQDVDCTG